MIRSLATIILLWIASHISVAMAADWKVASWSESMTIYVDTSSIVQASKLRKAWTWVDYSSKQYGSDVNDSYQSTLQLRQFNCRERTVGLSQVIIYSLPGRSGKTLFSEAYPASTLSEVAPESVGEALLEFVCKSPITR